MKESKKKVRVPRRLKKKAIKLVGKVEYLKWMFYLNNATRYRLNPDQKNQTLILWDNNLKVEIDTNDMDTDEVYYYWMRLQEEEICDINSYKSEVDNFLKTK